MPSLRPLAPGPVDHSCASVPMFLGRAALGTMPRGRVWEPQIVGGLSWAGAAEGTCEGVGTLSSRHRDWHKPGVRLAALLLVNTRRGYFTRKQ